MLSLPSKVTSQAKLMANPSMTFIVFTVQTLIGNVKGYFVCCIVPLSKRDITTANALITDSGLSS